MLKHFSTTTNRLERCRATSGNCRFKVHGSGVSDVSVLENAADEAMKQEDMDVYLAVREQLDSLQRVNEFLDPELPVYDDLNAGFYDTLRERYDTVAKNGTEFQLAPADNSHDYYCYTCFGPMVDTSVGDSFSAKCQACGEEVDTADEAGPLLNRGELFLFNDELARKASWYHSSDSPVWEERLTDGSITSVHAGSLSAAEDRASGLARGHETTWVYELKLKPDAKVNPDIFNDDPISSSKYDESADYDMARYMNLFEDSGSISVLLKADKFEIVSKKQIVS